MKITDIKGTVTLNNGVEMPYLGLGVFKVNDGTDVIDSVTHGLDAGYRHFDTASYYENESGVGEAIKQNKVGRNEIFVTSKLWNDDQGYNSTMKAFDVTMKRFGLDYLDLYLVHWPVKGKFKDSWRALEQIYRDGHVKAIGISNFKQHHIEDLLDSAEILPMVNQMEFHPRLVQQSLIDYCVNLTIQYQAWSPFMQGKILDMPEIIEIAAKYKKTTAQVVVRWNLQKGVVTIPKSIKKERIISNVDVFDFEISQLDMDLIDGLDRGERIGSNPDNFNF